MLGDMFVQFVFSIAKLRKGEMWILDTGAAQACSGISADRDSPSLGRSPQCPGRMLVGCRR